jgi:hypothetical protein
MSVTLRYNAAPRVRNEIVFVLLPALVLDCPISDCENEDDDEDERFARPAKIWTIGAAVPQNILCRAKESGTVGAYEFSVLAATILRSAAL